MSEFISVDDETPDSNKLVIVHGGVARYYSATGRWFSFTGCDGILITWESPTGCHYRSRRNEPSILGLATIQPIHQQTQSRPLGAVFL